MTWSKPLSNISGKERAMRNNEYLFLRAIKKASLERTPIWIMRQAGRYLPEYKALRQKYDFLTVCKTPELATEITLQPIRRFGFDAAILFADILLIPEALGQKLEFTADHGPLLSPPIRSLSDMTNLKIEAIREKLLFVSRTIQMSRRELAGKTPLIGFSGSPFTLAVYMIEGQPPRHFKHTKSFLYGNTALFHQLLQKLTTVVIDYLKMQIETGVEAVQIFDTWGNILPPHLFGEFSALYLKKIASDLKPLGVPVILYTRGGINHLLELKNSQAQVLGVDWQTDLAHAKYLFYQDYALQGNLDPAVLYGSKEAISREVERILSLFKNESGHIFNLGHGIPPDVPLDKVEFLVEEVRRLSAKYHKKKGDHEQ